MPWDDEFKEFFRAWYAELVAFLRRLGHVRESEDAAVEAMLALYRKWPTVTPEKRQGYVWKAGRRIARRMRERRDREGPLPPDVVDLATQLFPDDVVQAQLWSLRLAFLEHEIPRLPPQQREVLTLALQGFTDAQIAEVLGIDRSTVCHHRLAATRTLRHRWLEQHPDDGAEDTS